MGDSKSGEKEKIEMKILLFKGGETEREVSLMTAKNVSNSLKHLGHSVEEIDTKSNNLLSYTYKGIDLIFNANEKSILCISIIRPYSSNNCILNLSIFTGPKYCRLQVDLCWVGFRIFGWCNCCHQSKNDSNARNGCHFQRVWRDCQFACWFF